MIVIRLFLLSILLMQSFQLSAMSEHVLNFFFDKCRTGELDVVKNYLTSSKEYLTFLNHQGFGALHIAAMYGKNDVIQELIQSGAEIHMLDSKGRTALHHAVLKQYSDTVLFLLFLGAQHSIQSEDGSTPLHYAVQKEYPKITQILLDADADVDIQNSNGDTPAQLGLLAHKQEIRELFEKHVQEKPFDAATEKLLSAFDPAYQRKKQLKYLFNLVSRGILTSAAALVLYGYYLYY